MDLDHASFPSNESLEVKVAVGTCLSDKLKTLRVNLRQWYLKTIFKSTLYFRSSYCMYKSMRSAIAIRTSSRVVGSLNAFPRCQDNSQKAARFSHHGCA